MRRGKLLAAEQLFLKALAANPNHPEVLQAYSNLLAGAGKLKEAMAMKRKQQAVEPLAPYPNEVIAQFLWIDGKTDEALALVNSLPPDLDLRAELQARIEASLGHYSNAADALMSIAPDAYLPGIVETAEQLLRAAPKPANSPQSLPRLGMLGFAYLYAGAPERALEIFEVQAETGNLVPNFYAVVWHPSYGAVRKTERFKKFARDAGLVDYRHARGWPDVCHPVGADDFACE